MNKNKTDKTVVVITQWLGIALLAALMVWGSIYILKTEESAGSLLRA